MNEEIDRHETALETEDDGHPFLRGVLTGAAVGAGVGLLFAPRTGSQMRHAVGDQWSNVKQTAGAWAHETREYVREVSHAMTRKSHRDSSSLESSDLDFSSTHQPPHPIGSRR